MTTYHGAAELPLSTSGPVVPTASTAPTCPGSAAKCNAVTTIDMNGRPLQVTHAYDTGSVAWQDFAGHTVRAVANYAAGASGTADRAAGHRGQPMGRSDGVLDDD